MLILIQKILDRYLQSDPETVGKLAALSGKVFKIDAQIMGLNFYLIPNERSIQVVKDYSGEPTATIRGKPFGLLRLSLSKHPDKIFREKQVTLVGDTDAAQRLKALFDEMDIDWEEQLSGFVGDTLAHELGYFFRSFLTWQKQTTENFKQNTSEYLQEELRYFPTRFEVEEFLTRVDHLRDDVERLEALFKLLKQ